MAIIDQKVSENYANRDISSLSDRPNEDGVSTNDLKARFDQLGKEVIPKHNELIDELIVLLGGLSNDDASMLLTINAILTALEGIYIKTEVDGLLSTNATQDRDRANHTGTQSADTLTDGTGKKAYTALERTKLDGIESEANKYVLPIATTSVLGGVKAGSRVTIDNNGFISVEGDVLSFDRLTKLIDFPISYVGQAQKFVKVKQDETGVEFVDGVLASKVSVVDSANHYIGDDTEEILDEIGDLLELGVYQSDEEIVPDVLSQLHNELSAKQGGTTNEYYHLTQAQHTDLTDGGETLLHKHRASDINNTPSGNISAVTVEGALNELDTEKSDKIFGTNLVTNGDFSNGITGWTSSNITITAVANECIATITTINAYARIMRTLSGLLSTDKLYARFEVYPKYTMNAGIRLSSVDYGVKSCIANQWNSVSAVIVKGVENDLWLFHDVRSSYIIGDQYKYRLSQLLNLTQIFGAGKEPTALEMDAILSYFPNSWFNGTTDILPLLNVAKQLSLKANKLGNVIFDNTYNNSYLAGVWSVDAATNIISCSVNHGLALNATVSFNALSGTLPSGILGEPEFYYVISVPTSTTITISSTYQGTILDITSVGVSGWAIRNALVSSANNTLNFLDYNEITIYARMDVPPLTISSYPLIEFAGTATRVQLNDVATLGNASHAPLYTSTLLSNKKYARFFISIFIRKINTQFYMIEVNVGGIGSGSLDFSLSPLVVSKVYIGSITNADITSMNIRDGYTSGYKNGTRIIGVTK